MKLIVFLIAVVSVVGSSQIAELKCWTQRNQTQYGGPGLDKSANINDTIQCITKCRENDFCHAVDIDTATSPNCWYHQQSTFVASETDLKPRDTVTNYLYDPMCGKVTVGVDLNCWTVTAGHQIKGLKQVDKKTLSDCLKECSGKSDCQVVNWDVKSSPSCWIQATALNISNDKFVKRESVTSFILNRECFNLTAGLDLTFWRVSHLTKYAGPGLVHLSKYDVKSCLDYCTSDEVCTMVEINTAKRPPCFGQIAPFDIKRGKLTESKTVYNFLLKRAEYEKSKSSLPK